jgi:hypothetical protein
LSPICTGREDADAASEEEEEEGENFLEFKVGEGIPAIKVRPGRSYSWSIHNTGIPAIKVRPGRL